MQVYIADREGDTDSKGRYKGPKVSKATDVKCTLRDEKSRTYDCTFEFTIRRKSTEVEKGKRAFRKVPIKVEEKGKQVDRLFWRVVS